jgi:hypothetical protein
VLEKVVEYADLRKFERFYQRHWVWMSVSMLVALLGLFAWCALSKRSTYSTVFFGAISGLLLVAIVFRATMTRLGKY